MELSSSRVMGVDRRGHPARPRLGALGVALGLALSLGCEGGSSAEQAAPDVAPAPASPSASFEPLTPAPGRFVADSGRISVPIPSGPGWECLEERNGDAAGSAVALRCRREHPREFLFLAAKTHRQPPDQRTNAKTVLMTLYREQNERFFERVEYLRDEAATLAGAEGWESELRAEHARAGPIHKRERLAIVGDRIYALSAEGVPDLWSLHAEAIDAWFEGVEFARAP